MNYNIIYSELFSAAIDRTLINDVTNEPQKKKKKNMNATGLEPTTPRLQVPHFINVPSPEENDVKVHIITYEIGTMALSFTAS